MSIEFPGQQSPRHVALRRAVVLSAITLLAIAPRANAQGAFDNDPDGAQGYTQSVFHHGSVDSINLYNGQLTIPIALGPSYPVGPKLRFQALLTYGSRSLDITRTGNQYSGGQTWVRAFDPALAPGWTFDLGAIKDTVVFSPNANLGSYHTFISPDGSQHVLGQVGSTSYYRVAGCRIRRSLQRLRPRGWGGP